MGSKKGFSVIFILLILGSLVLLLLAFGKAADIRASGSVAREICMVCGRSLLSEYCIELYERYGLFALNSSNERLEKIAQKYIEIFQQRSTGILKLNVQDISVKTDEYPGLNYEIFAEQVESIGRLLAAKDFVVPENPGSSNDFECPISNINENSKGSLPSDFLEYDERFSILLSGGIAELDVNKVWDAAYILNMCSSRLKPIESFALYGECEYILYGNETDSENFAKVESAIRDLRLAIDIAKLSENPANLLNGELLPLLLIEAYLQAEQETDLILAGNCVPIVEGTQQGYYRDYLQLLLISLPKKELICRLMDVIQMNLNSEDDCFYFCNGSYGFELEVKFDKGTICQVHRYQ